MNKVKIGDIATVYDGPHATPKKIAQGPIYLGLDGITDDGRFNPSGFAHLSEEDYAVWTRRVTPQEDDIVFSYEATLGRYVLIPKGFYGCLGRRLGIVRCDKTKVNPRWLYYFFLSPEWTRFTQSHKVRGSTVDRLSVDDFPGYEIPLPSLDEQNRAVSAIFPIDQKIDINTRLCAELEDMTKTLYDYWFMQFDFPDENGKPYRTSGGAMEWCQELGREVPKGWKSYKLGDISTFKNGINYEKAAIGDKEYRIINVRDISSSTLLIDEHRLDNISLPQKQADKYLVSIDDIIIARSGTPGATRLLVRSVYPTIFCGFIICCTPLKDIYKYYLLHLLKKYEGTSATKTGGSILQNVSQETLKSIGVILPQEETMIRFNKNVIPYYRKEQQLIEENYELETLRDWLLPMLMNGQAHIEVGGDEPV